MKYDWKHLGIVAGVIILSVLAASFIKEKVDEFRLKKAMAKNPATDVPVTETTATGQLLSPVR
jgi:hypothetical protein